MRRMLTLALALHWMSIYTMLAAVCVVRPSTGFAAPLLFLGAEPLDFASAGGAEASAFFATLFALSAVLFLLAFVDVAFGHEVRRRPVHVQWAFGAGVLSQTLLLCVGALYAVPGFFIPLECMLAASLASYLAIQLEWRARVFAETRGDGVRAAARVMALGAAHSSLLQRLPAALQADPPQGRP